MYNVTISGTDSPSRPIWRFPAMNRRPYTVALLLLGSVLLSCRHTSNTQPAKEESGSDRTSPTSSATSAMPDWDTYVSPLGYTFDSPPNARVSGVAVDDVEVQAGEINIRVLATSRQERDTGRIVTNEEMIKGNGPGSPNGPPKKLKAGVLDGLISEGQDPGDKWVTVITAVSAERGYVFATSTPASSRVSAHEQVSRITSSFAVTKPLTQQAYEDLLMQQRVAGTGLQVVHHTNGQPVLDQAAGGSPEAPVNRLLMQKTKAKQSTPRNFVMGLRWSATLGPMLGSFQRETPAESQNTSWSYLMTPLGLSTLWTRPA